MSSEAESGEDDEDDERAEKEAMWKNEEEYQGQRG